MPNSLKFPSDQKAIRAGARPRDDPCQRPAVLRMAGELAAPAAAGRDPAASPGSRRTRTIRTRGCGTRPARRSRRPALRSASRRARSPSSAGPFVFSLFLAIGYDAFHLSHAPGVRLPGGVPVFREQKTGRSPEDGAGRGGAEGRAGPTVRRRRDHGRVDAQRLRRIAAVRSPRECVCGPKRLGRRP